MAREFDYSKLPPEVAAKIRILSGPRKIRRYYRGNGCIYFLQQGDDGPIKIGYTKDLLARIKDLQVGSPYELKLILSFRGFPEKERELHAKFREHRMSGEWFTPSDEIMEFVKEQREWLEI